jgi:ceramide glucosyltransferase
VAGIFGTLALVSLSLTLWQWLAARRFPLHRRIESSAFVPPVTLLKPLHGADACTEGCLRSWLAQEYPGELQFLFAVDRAEDPVCDIVRVLLREFPQRDAQLVVCSGQRGANPKVAKLAHIEPSARHPTLVLSDADVFAPPDCLANLVAPLQDGKVGIVNCFYQSAETSSAAMRWEGVAINADFWSQVLQARSLGPLKFALGATLAVRREALREIGGFAALADCLADDYELGKRVAAHRYQIELCPVVTECREAPRGWRATWRHQLRWARTIRVCQPGAYFASILGNATLWPLAWLGACPNEVVLKSVVALLVVRLIVAGDLMERLTRRKVRFTELYLVWMKDLLQVAIWFCAFAGNAVEWRGENYRVDAAGGLKPER